MKRNTTPQRKRPKRKDDQPGIERYKALYASGLARGIRLAFAPETMVRRATLVAYDGDNRCVRCFLADLPNSCKTYNALCAHGYFRFKPEHYPGEVFGLSLDNL